MAKAAIFRNQLDALLGASVYVCPDRDRALSQAELRSEVEGYVSAIESLLVQSWMTCRAHEPAPQINEQRLRIFLGDGTASAGGTKTGADNGNG